ncbi:PP2C family protein-serine/threonine phosphatase [Streptomyces lateritius]|uniref:PP2C family protein-serine/threonine phosphatase n=1 Tax=Streptomyces lateritius TaxID=67313 RepID=UPI001C8C9B11|nr:PP2C family protein-serine/threonine phosphatase [Streptomyces lateritius]MBX9426704.1 serine/threonine-protein phosphatase [Streptomyces lateritius]
MDEITGVEQALRRAAPHLLVSVVEEALREHRDARRVELRLADYGLRSLQLVGGAPDAPRQVLINDSPQGRAFNAQEPYVTQEADSVSVHLPVTIRGDRMGVLTVGMPAGTDLVPLLPELRHLCEALGHEILVAERDTDLYVLARRATRLTLAAEMQWQLLPGRSCARPEFALGAHLEPAYAIFGDNYDWSASADHLTLTVTNGMGEGIEAALLTNLAINALRNARRAGLGLADQAALADQAVYAQYRGSAFISVLLLRFDLATGEVEAVDAGSPRLWRLRGRNVERISLEAQLPLGMFEESAYVPERFTVLPGDRLLFGSDGVYDAASPEGESYGERALARALTATRLLPPTQVPGAVLRELATYHGGTPLEDDALVVCLDWQGRQ